MDTNKIGQLTTKRIKLWGIVQGVGFRPFVAKLADVMQIRGEVRNLGGLVEITLTDTEDRIAGFIADLKAKKPEPAEIVHIRVDELPFRLFEDFTILDSGSGGDEAAMIPADLPICPDCLRELRDPENPRYRHPYISCMACGPRYTIIDRIPYDRENTSMADFQMCPMCEREYGDLHDRRHHAQTISCHDCGPYNKFMIPDAAAEGGGASGGAETGGSRSDKAVRTLSALNGAVVPGKHAIENEQALEEAAALILRGGILAFKAAGGYNFVCSPFMDQAVRNLRVLKAREDKPFAVMFGGMDQIRQYCHATTEEEELLVSSARPIVLLERRSESLAGQMGKSALGSRSISPEVCRTSRFIGAFLPSMGIQHLLIDACGPLIMTSANLSDQPIIIGDREMADILSARRRKLAKDGFSVLETAILYNEREIRIRMDDSVARVIDGQPQMIRRSKGYAPVPLHLQLEALDAGDMVLAAGGQLKASFCLTKGPFAYVSQFFGDLDSLEAAGIYIENVDRMKTLFRIEPGLVVCDLHPLYYTTGFAEACAERIGSTGKSIGLMRVQHHHAHVASVMAEHDLSGPVLGVSFDGTGYGTDGAVWGGEFLLCEGTGFERMAHLDYVKMLGGDTSMKEGWKSAMSYLHAFGLDQYAGDQRYPIVRAGLEHGVNTIESSSMGRLFDGVAAFMGIQDTNRYEGECAIMLENAAAEALLEGLAPIPMKFAIGGDLGISAKPIFTVIAEALDHGPESADGNGSVRKRLALGFHEAVAEMILAVCARIREDRKVSRIALTGGVFQNRILMERTLELLRKEGFDAYYNISVGPNDGGICLGQAYLGMRRLAEAKLAQEKLAEEK